MRNFDEYNKDYNDIKLKNGYKIFKKQLDGLEGVFIQIDGKKSKCLVINEENINSDKREFRTVCMEKEVLCEHGSYIKYHDETYLVVTDIDDHYYYKSCKMQKCKNILKWKIKDKIFEYPCILANDSYGVKILSDNEYKRNQNIKAQILVQDNKDTKKIIQDMRFMFNNSKFDIYNVIDISASMINGVITLTSEKSTYRYEDDLDNNIAFSEVLLESNKPDDGKDEKPQVPQDYEIIGNDNFKQIEECEYQISPLIDCEFYIDDFDSQHIASIIQDDKKGTCKVKGIKTISSNYFTLYAKKDNVVIAKKKIDVLRK